MKFGNRWIALEKVIATIFMTPLNDFNHGYYYCYGRKIIKFGEFYNCSVNIDAVRPLSRAEKDQLLSFESFEICTQTSTYVDATN